MQDIDLSVSEAMNPCQQAHFLQLEPNGTAELEFDKIMPHLYYPPARDLSHFEKTAENYEQFLTDFKG